jgi:hypothetical protein
MNKYILIINTDYEPSSFYAFESSKSFRELNDQLLSELSRLKKVRVIMKIIRAVVPILDLRTCLIAKKKAK